MNKISMRNFELTITRVLLTGATILLTAGGVLLANPTSLSGVVQTGGTSSNQPLPNVHVTLFEATSGLPTSLGEATTDGSGQFSIRYTRSTSRSIFFVQADVAVGVEFVTILGSKLPASVTLNELATVAASYSMAQFYRTGVISGNSFGLLLAAGMNDNIVNAATGQSSPVLLNSPNADQTNSLRSTRSLANLLAMRSGCERHSDPVRADHAAGRFSSEQYRAVACKSRSRSRAARGWNLRVDAAEQFVCAAADHNARRVDGDGQGQRLR